MIIFTGKQEIEDVLKLNSQDLFKVTDTGGCTHFNAKLHFVFILRAVHMHLRSNFGLTSKLLTLYFKVPRIYITY